MRLADMLVLMSEGTVAAVGTVEDLTSRLDLRPLTGRLRGRRGHRAAVVAEHDADYELTRLAFPGGRLSVARLDLPVGAKVRVRMRARDVVLAPAPPGACRSATPLPARFVEIAAAGGPAVDLRLDVGGEGQPVMLWARITRRALAELGLEVGSPVFALVKTVALDRSSFARHEPGLPPPDESEAGD